MNPTKEAFEIIRTLERNRFYAQCPCCDDPILLKDAGLFFLNNFTTEAESLYNLRLKELKERQKLLHDRRKAFSKTSEVGAKAVNIGLILERLCPSMKQFCFNRNDCRSLFDPIDYIVFEGLSTKGSVSKIIFMDIKTGHARLQPTQKEIRRLIERKQVIWDTYSTEVS